MRIGRLVQLCGLVLILVFGCLPVSAASNNLDAGEVIREPHLIIPGQMDAGFKAGRRFRSTFHRNTTNGTAKNVEVSLVVGDLSKFPFKSEKMTFTKHISSSYLRHGRSRLQADRARQHKPESTRRRQRQI